METALIWGWLLTMQTGEMPPIIDVNYTNEASCEAVKADLVPLYPTYQIYCTPTWKPETAPKVKKKAVKKKVAKKPTTKKPVAKKPTYSRTRTARR